MFQSFVWKLDLHSIEGVAAGSSVGAEDPLSFSPTGPLLKSGSPLSLAIFSQ
jgi:hypothetical protein